MYSWSCEMQIYISEQNQIFFGTKNGRCITKGAIAKWLSFLQMLQQLEENNLRRNGLIYVPIKKDERSPASHCVQNTEFQFVYV